MFVCVRADSDGASRPRVAHQRRVARSGLTEAERDAAAVLRKWLTDFLGSTKSVISR